MLSKQNRFPHQKKLKGKNNFSIFFNNIKVVENNFKLKNRCTKQNIFMLINCKT